MAAPGPHRCARRRRSGHPRRRPPCHRPLRHPWARRETIVVVHGYGDDRNSPPVIDATRWLHDAGYGVLAIDLGYLHGRHRYSAGNREAADISAAIDWLHQRGDTLAGVWGFSPAPTLR